MFNKKITLILLILVFMLSLSAVSAVDASSSDDIITSNVDEEPPSGVSDSPSLDNLTATNQDTYTLSSSDLKMYEKNGSSFNATLKKGTSPVKGASVIIGVNGKNYTLTTDESGVASLPIRLKEGNYTIFSYYGTLSNSNKIIILPVITAKDLNKFRGGNESFTAKFLNGNGKALANADITFRVNGKDYIQKTNSKGVASLPIGLKPGSYVMTSIHPNGAKISNNILVVEAIKASNLNMFQGSGVSYTAEFFNVKGNPLAKKDIIFSINGKNYTIKTNSKGVASIPINLKARTYVMTSIHPSGIQLSKNIVVVEAIKSSDLTMYYNSGESYTAKFFNTDGNPLANEDIIFNINGKNYTKRTDSSGVAKIPIGLKPGSYVMTSIHPSGIQLSKSLIVKTTIVSSDLTKHYKSSKHFTATFYGKNGKVLANKNIKFTKKTDSGQTTDFTVTTNSNGVATLKVISEPNKFSIICYNTQTGEKVTNTVEILPTVFASSMTVYEGATSKFIVTLYKGESLAENTNMNIYIDGSKKTAKTNTKGVATLSFNNLNEGTHVFKSVDPFTGYSINTNVYVKAAPIKADDMRVKENTTSKFKATLYKENGDVAASTKMQITINGVTKTVKTNSKGVASYSFNLPKGVYSAVCKDLATGYTLTKTIIVGSVTYNKYGVSDDGKTILAIGRPSAAGELDKYGYTFYVAEFERTCPSCGNHELYWSIFWTGDETTNYGYFPVTGKGEGSSAEGLILCADCDCDWSVFGHDHGGIYDLTVVTSPVKTTKDQAYALLKGNYVLA